MSRRHGARRPFSCNRGVAATEFALVAPVLILLFVGSFQMADAIAASRKVTTTARALADLTSQYTSVSGMTVDTILRASQQVMQPYSSKDGTFTLTVVSTGNGGASKVAWSKKLVNEVTSTAYEKESKFTLPVSAANPGTSVVVADVTYIYKPIIAPSMFGQFTMTDRIYMLPRRSVDIPLMEK